MNCEEDDESEHNPDIIIEKANEKMEQNDLEGARMICQSALLDWVDDAREMSGDADRATVKKIRVAIADLWIGYANLYRKIKKVSISLPPTHNNKKDIVLKCDSLTKQIRITYHYWATYSHYLSSLLFVHNYVV